MIVCIDTNSLVQLFGKRSRFRAIAAALMDARIELAVSSAILLEYEEVAAAMYGPEFAREVMSFLDLATAAGSVRRINPSFHFRMISADPDDDIFADCAIAADAEHIITEDRHFEACGAPATKRSRSRRTSSSGASSIREESGACKRGQVRVRRQSRDNQILPDGKPPRPPRGWSGSRRA